MMVELTREGWKVLDETNVQDPEVLLEVISELLAHQRMVQSSVAMLAILLLDMRHQVPIDADMRESITKRLVEFIEITQKDSHRGVQADQYIEFLESQE